MLCGDVRRVWMGAEGGGGENEARLPGGEGTDVRAIGGVAPTGRRAGAGPVGGTNASRGRREALRTIFFLALPLCSPPSGWRRHSTPPAIQGGYCTVHCKRRHLRTPFHPHRTGHGGVRGGGGAVRRLRLPSPAAVGAPPPAATAFAQPAVHQVVGLDFDVHPTIIVWLSPYDRERAQTRLKRCHVLTELS